MLDRRFIRENPDAVKTAVRGKGIDLDVDELLQLDNLSRELQHELDQARARRRSSSKESAQADEARRAELRAEHEERETQLRANSLDELLLRARAWSSSCWNSRLSLSS